MKSNSKKLLSVLLVLVMIFAINVTSFARSTTTVTVSIKTTGVEGDDIKPAQTVILNKNNPTALDALRALYSNYSTTSQTEMISIGGYPTPTTCYYQGDLKWYMGAYGNYIPAVKVSGHSSTNKYYAANGTASTDPIAVGYDYFHLDDLNYTETHYMNVSQNATWTNTVAASGYLTEKDYNNYSGWMVIINGSSPYYGLDTQISNGDIIELDFTMMMGLDLGQDSWVETSPGNWTQVSAWQ